MAKMKEKDILTDHDYDGIKEFDNDLPPWWLWLFYLSILWAVVYMVHYHVLGTGDSPLTEYQKEMDPSWKAPAETHDFSIGYRSPFYTGRQDITPLSRIESAAALEAEKAFQAAVEGGKMTASSLESLSFEELVQAAMTVASPEQLGKLQQAFPEIQPTLKDGAKVASAAPAISVEPLTDAASLASGESIFTTNCVSCHGKAAGGGIGPNLTDDYYLHGPTPGNMVTTITSGVPAKGMISWRGILTDKQILEVASYILTLKGSDPANAKAPQGEKARQ